MFLDRKSQKKHLPGSEHQTREWKNFRNPKKGRARNFACLQEIHQLFAVINYGQHFRVEQILDCISGNIFSRSFPIWKFNWWMHAEADVTTSASLLDNRWAIIRAVRRETNWRQIIAKLYAAWHRLYVNKATSTRNLLSRPAIAQQRAIAKCMMRLHNSSNDAWLLNKRCWC